MRKITVCEALGPRLVPDADHKQKLMAYALSPGTAWRLDDVSRDHHVVEVTAADCKAARPTHRSRWLDGRTVEVFQVVDALYAQPVDEDPRAKTTALGSQRKRALRKTRRDAPGVAPEVLGSVTQLEAAPTRRKRSGPRGGLALLG
jgi:hypothetical protein